MYNQCMKVIIIPGNGNTDINDIWFPSVKQALEKKSIEVIAHNMPDPELARKDIWLPYIKNELKADENTIAIGHSSGAVALMRYLETSKLLGAILIGASHSDLGYESEKLSGYFDIPWEWETIRSNAGWIIQYASQDDPYIPIAEARLIHEKLNTEYHEYTDQGHFGDGEGLKKDFPELVNDILRKVANNRG